MQVTSIHTKAKNIACLSLTCLPFSLFTKVWINPPEAILVSPPRKNNVAAPPKNLYTIVFVVKSGSNTATIPPVKILIDNINNTDILVLGNVIMYFVNFITRSDNPIINPP